MRQYIIRRSLLVIPTLLGISIIVFMMLRLVPGSVADIIISQAVRSGNIGSAAVMDVDEIKRALGLDVPVHVQYGRWIGDIVFRGSLGDSLIKNVPVTDLIIGKLAVTVELGLLAVLFSNIVSFPIGVYSAIRQDTIADYTGRTIAILFMAVPSFWIATMIMIYPSIWWRWSPSVDLVPFMENPLGNLKVFLIPSFLLGMAMAGDNMRMTRTMMLEVLRQDYIRTAYSKGLREGVVVLRHAPEECADSGGDLDRSRAARVDRRLHNHRADLLPARHRTFLDPGAGAKRLHGRRRNKPGDCHRCSCGEPIGWIYPTATWTPEFVTPS